MQGRSVSPKVRFASPRFAIHQFREEIKRGAGRVAAIGSASTDREDALRDRNRDWRRDRVRSESRFGRLKQVDAVRPQ